MPTNTKQDRRPSGRPRIGPPYEFHMEVGDKERLRNLAEMMESDMAPIAREAMAIGLRAIEKRIGL